MSSSTVKLEIHRPDKEPSSFDIESGIYTVGSDSDCKIALPHSEVDGRHAILTVQNSEIWIEDLASESGTLIDGLPVSGRAEVADGQKISVGPFTLIVNPSQAPVEVVAVPEAELTPEPAIESTPAPEKKLSDPAMDQKRSIKQQIHKELVERMDIKRMSISGIGKDALVEKARSTINEIVKDVQTRLPPGISPDDLAEEIFNEALALGPLEIFLADDDITEIMVNGPDQIYVEKNGKLTLTDQTFMDNASVLAIIERIVSPLGRRIDESQPYVDARLEDGSRVNAIINPLSLIGPCLTIRKFSKIPFTDKDLINFGTMTADIAEFISICVRLRKNIIVAGGTGSGKTSLLNVLSSYIPNTDRIVTIEDAAELRLTQDHIVRLESRPPNIEGKGAITIRDLVRNALRMRPDRIVVGECRGGEALDMLQAMNTGHDGSLTTVHANAPRDVISRLETMVLMSGMELPVRAIREQIASAVDMIVHESRMSDGSRKITNVTEIVGQEGDQITMQDIFEFKQTGIGEEGKVLGSLSPTGSVPTFLEEIKSQGMTIDHSMFSPDAAI
jgi:pilus assembly protein CpaF